jgi:hypothetical protein
MITNNNNNKVRSTTTTHLKSRNNKTINSRTRWSQRSTQYNHPQLAGKCAVDANDRGKIISLVDAGERG